MASREVPDTKWFEYRNENPKGRIASDCVVRAIATATGRSWDDVLDGLVEVGHRYKLVPNEPRCYGRYLESLGFVKMRQPRRSDNTKYTGKQFCDWMMSNNIEDPIVANIGGGHVTVFMPGKYKALDIWDCTDKTIGNYWIKTAVSPWKSDNRIGDMHSMEQYRRGKSDTMSMYFECDRCHTQFESELGLTKVAIVDQPKDGIGGRTLARHYCPFCRIMLLNAMSLVDNGVYGGSLDPKDRIGKQLTRREDFDPLVNPDSQRERFEKVCVLRKED